MQVDLLVFGPHPDDIEIGLGGAIARHVAMGFAVALCDLTRGEMGSNGTPEQRQMEAEAAREVLGAASRVNLGIPDRGIGRDPAHLDAAVDIIRRWRPRSIAAPYWDDRHPDHAAASALVTEAAFNAGLRRYPGRLDAWRPDWICYYFINTLGPASFVIDVSDVYEKKRQALQCYRSQFQRQEENAVDTRLNSPLFMQLVESRDAQFGATSGVRFAEGVLVREPVLRPHLLRNWESSGEIT